MKLRLAALGIAAVLLCSCLPVPFDLSISQSAQTASKMTKDNPGSITTGYNQNGTQTGFAFSPSVLAAGGFDYTAGFVTALDNLAVDIQAVSGGNQYAGQSQPLANPDAHAPPYLVWPAKSGVSFLFGIGFDAVNPTQSGYGIFQGTPSPPSLAINPAPSGGSLTSLVSPSPFASGTSVLGASVTADPNLSFDDLHLLGWDGAGNFMEVRCTLQSTGVGAGVAIRNAGNPYSLGFIPTGITRVMYFYDENVSADPARLPNRSFGSWYDSSSGSWVTYAWWETPSTGTGVFAFSRLPIDHRIDALLSTGQLLSTEGGTGRLYDRDGNLLSSFPLGSLVYIGEQYVGAVARAYFSECLIYGNQMHFNVYWIQSARLSSLGS